MGLVSFSTARQYVKEYLRREFPRFSSKITFGSNGHNGNGNNGNGDYSQTYAHSEGETFTPAVLSKARKFLRAEVARRSGLYAYFRPISSEQGTEVVMEGKKVLMFGSNSYLGLTNHPKVKEAAIEAVRKYGTGNAGSRFLNGTLDLHVELEARLAALVNKPAALIYSTGFQSNLGAIGTIVGRKDKVILDDKDHASIYQGSSLSLGEMTRFKHNDMKDLENILASMENSTGKLIVVDGIFSMEGDLTNLPEICNLRRKYNAAVMVDDAHALGVIGKNGSGTANHFGLTDQVDLIMSTFSKSLASQGGFIASDANTIDFLKHNSPPLIFSASMPPSNAASVLAALEIMKSEPQRIEKLWANTNRMRKGFESMGYQLGNTQSPILPVRIGGLEDTLKFCLKLQDEGVFANPVVSPGVPKGEELIRVSLMATHEYAQIDKALEKFEKIGKEMGKI